MKKIRNLLLLPLLSTFLVAGCNAGGGDDSSGDASTSSASGENLPIDGDTAKTKLYELGKSSGFEIEYCAFDEEENESVTYTYGFKTNATWFYEIDGEYVDKVLLTLSDDSSTVSVYGYDAENDSFIDPTEVPNEEDFFNEYMVSLTTVFYIANQYDGLEGYHKVRDLTFAGRSAAEYRFDYTYPGVGSASFSAIIDKEIGITLYWNAQASVDGESDSATFEVTSFKTGSQVSVPAH